MGGLAAFQGVPVPPSHPSGNISINWTRCTPLEAQGAPALPREFWIHPTGSAAAEVGSAFSPCSIPQREFCWIMVISLESWV